MSKKTFEINVADRASLLPMKHAWKKCIAVGRGYDFKRPEGMRPTCGLLVTDESSATRALVWNCCFPHGEMDDCILKLRLPPPTN